MAKQKQQTGRKNPRGLRKDAAAEALAAALEAAWWKSFYALVVFQQQRGHCDVPVEAKQYRPLSAWLATQRAQQARGVLAEDRRRELEALGVDFTPDEEEGDWRTGLDQFRDELWDQRYEELAAFHRRFGHTRVTKAWQENPGLHKWRHFQRVLFRQGKIDPARRARLDALGFEWVEPGRFAQTRIEQWQKLWEERYAELSRFQQKHGHCDPGFDHSKNESLAKWVQRQRIKYNARRMPPEQIRCLEALGFQWKSEFRHNTDRWEQRFEELVAYHRRFGHVRVTRQWKKNPGLASWLDHQKEKQRAGTLPPDRLARLEALGFTEEQSEPRGVRQTRSPQWEKLWARQVRQLKAFKKKHGHVLVPVNSEVYPALSNWVLRVREKYRSGQLRPDRIEELNALEFIWKPLSARATARWEQGYAALKEFHRRFGHTRVTERFTEQPGLWKFRHYQRTLWRQGRLDPQHKALLDALGFDWEDDAPVVRASAEFNDPGWQDMFARLTAFHQRFGHTRVPHHWTEDCALGRWVHRLRHRLRSGKILPERAAALEKLGFTINAKGLYEDDLWDRRYEELRAFHQQHGHTRVPSREPRYAALYAWRSQQRKHQHAGTLSPSRISRLDALGFEWRG